jgi:methyl-accepting chemotaxis protein
VLTSLVVPIQIDGKFVGVVGVDIATDDFQKRVSTIRPYGDGYASLISRNGVYVADADPALVGKDAKTRLGEGVMKAVKEGREVQETSYSQRLKENVMAFTCRSTSAASVPPGPWVWRYPKVACWKKSIVCA